MAHIKIIGKATGTDSESYKWIIKQKYINLKEDKISIRKGTSVGVRENKTVKYNQEKIAVDWNYPKWRIISYRQIT